MTFLDILPLILGERFILDKRSKKWLGIFDIRITRTIMFIDLLHNSENEFKCYNPYSPLKSSDLILDIGHPDFCNNLRFILDLWAGTNRGLPPHDVSYCPHFMEENVVE